MVLLFYSIFSSSTFDICPHGEEGSPLLDFFSVRLTTTLDVMMNSKRLIFLFAAGGLWTNDNFCTIGELGQKGQAVDDTFFVCLLDRGRERCFCFPRGRTHENEEEDKNDLTYRFIHSLAY
jgi:hypothetical protein